jgi:hypothetical protein
MSLVHTLLEQNPNYIYPLAVNVVAALVPVWASLQVTAARRRTDLKYPAEYHFDALTKDSDQTKYLFNCTQRAHQVGPFSPWWLTLELIGGFAVVFRHV